MARSLICPMSSSQSKEEFRVQLHIFVSFSIFSSELLQIPAADTHRHSSFFSSRNEIVLLLWSITDTAVPSKKTYSWKKAISLQLRHNERLVIFSGQQTPLTVTILRQKFLIISVFSLNFLPYPYFCHFSITQLSLQDLLSDSSL